MTSNGSETASQSIPLSKSIESHSPAEARAGSQKGSKAWRSTPASLGKRRSTSAALMRRRPGMSSPPALSKWAFACRMKGTIFSPMPPASKSSDTMTSKRSSSVLHSTARRSAHCTTASTEASVSPEAAITRRAHRARCGVISTPVTLSAPARRARRERTPTPQPRSMTRQQVPPSSPPFVGLVVARARSIASTKPAAKARLRGPSFIISEYQSSKCVREKGSVANKQKSPTSNHIRWAVQEQHISTSTPGSNFSSLAGRECKLSKVWRCSTSAAIPNTAVHRNSTVSG
mmetsp:Transcript_8224/g.22606  ORF Transcript_8224/g.22606 Transcript_8224/m.22606 type:complete len:289 (+) Transcript_8224:616-1482(+)